MMDSMHSTPLPPTAMPDADFFRALEVKRTRSLVDRDLPTIERLHAPDYELISAPGRVMGIQRYLSLIAAAPFYTQWEHGPMRVRLSQGMAAVRYQAKISFPSGKVVECWHTDIYELQAGAWRASWSQATPVPSVLTAPTSVPQP
jgi:Domain of unknown function (DUF4440)